MSHISEERESKNINEYCEIKGKCSSAAAEVERIDLSRKAI